LDLNLDTLKRDVLDYLETSGFAVFRSAPGALEGQPMVLWDTEKHPDYQLFLETAKKSGTKLVLFASREFDADEIDEALEDLEEAEVSREERREFERRLREFRSFEGGTCSIELAFDHHSRLYVYEVQPDWYEDFVSTCDEIAVHLPGGEEEEDESSDGFGGYFSRN
jgi:hypothetical protein